MVMYERDASNQEALLFKNGYPKTVFSTETSMGMILQYLIDPRINKQGISTYGQKV